MLLNICAGIRFYLYLFCVTLFNIVITVVLPVRGVLQVPSYEAHLTISFVQLEFVSVGSRFGYSISFSTTPLLTPHSVEIVLHSVLTCRLIIGMREASESPGTKPETYELALSDNATLEFTTESA